jgi:hypothetical protein
VAIPAATPLTTPVPPPTVAIAVLLLVHVPPAGAEVSVVEDPTHIAADPEIADGSGFTVNIAIE